MKKARTKIRIICILLAFWPLYLVINPVYSVESLKAKLSVSPPEKDRYVLTAVHPGSDYLKAKRDRILSSIEKERDIYINPEDLEYLAIAIYQESGGEECCDECRRRVADVILNRVASDAYPDTIEGVLTEYRQYGRFYWTGLVWPDRAALEEEKAAVERAYQIAKEALSGKHSSLYGEGYIYQAEFAQGTDIIEHCGMYYGRERDG